MATATQLAVTDVVSAVAESEAVAANAATASMAMDKLATGR